LSIHVSGSVAAQQSATPSTTSPEDVRAIKERVAYWLKSCLADWDRATHMTASEWRTACHRITAEREKLLLSEVGETVRRPTGLIKLESPAPKSVQKVAIQVNQNDRAVMDLALNNAKNIIDHYKGETVEIEIVTFGPGLNMLRADTSPVKERIAPMALLNPNLKFIACANTQANQSKAEGKPVTLIGEAKVVPSGVVHLMELKKQGYAYIRP
jgi:intracellular sulfur oxidation DsrE/DsrF family protein